MKKPDPAGRQVPHGAWTTDPHCREAGIFCPPRTSPPDLASRPQEAAEAGPAGAGQRSS